MVNSMCNRKPPKQKEKELFKEYPTGGLGWVFAVLVVFWVLMIYLIASCDLAFGAERKKESHYSKNFCEWQRGQPEVRLTTKFNKTPLYFRADCVNSRLAYEVDFAKKFYEAIGQSLLYAYLTDKRPAIGLIIQTSKDWKRYYLMWEVIKHYNLPIEIFFIFRYQ